MKKSKHYVMKNVKMENLYKVLGALQRNSNVFNLDVKGKQFNGLIAVEFDYFE